MSLQYCRYWFPLCCRHETTPSDSWDICFFETTCAFQISTIKKTFVFYTFISHDSWEKLSSFESASKCSLSLSVNQITLVLTIQCSTVATFMQHSVPNLKFGLHLYINYWLEDSRQSNNCLVIHYLHEEHNPWYPHSAHQNKTSFNGHQQVLVCELIHSCTV